MKTIKYFSCRPFNAKYEKRYGIGVAKNLDTILGSLAIMWGTKLILIGPHIQDININIPISIVVNKSK